MKYQGLKVPMIRGANGFALVEDDDLLETALQFFLGTYANHIGTAGEAPWDHRFGVPAEGLRHRNMTAGLLEWFASVAAARANRYFEGLLRVRAFEPYSELTRLWLRVHWSNIFSNEERPTDVQFPA